MPLRESPFGPAADQNPWVVVRHSSRVEALRCVAHELEAAGASLTAGDTKGMAEGFSGLYPRSEARASWPASAARLWRLASPRGRRPGRHPGHPPPGLEDHADGGHELLEALLVVGVEGLAAALVQHLRHAENAL